MCIIMSIRLKLYLFIIYYTAIKNPSFLVEYLSLEDGDVKFNFSGCWIDFGSTYGLVIVSSEKQPASPGTG